MIANTYDSSTTGNSKRLPVPKFQWLASNTNYFGEKYLETGASAGFCFSVFLCAAEVIGCTVSIEDDKMASVSRSNHSPTFHVKLMTTIFQLSVQSTSCLQFCSKGAGPLLIIIPSPPFFKDIAKTSRQNDKGYELLFSCNGQQVSSTSNIL